MSKIVLEGGTDIAEMVLFSVDDLPSGGADDETLASLVGRKQAIRFPTGADGGYLLHLYVDDEIPENIRQYCIIDDSIEAEFFSKSGRIAFGGAESTLVEFKQNPNVRTDASISSGKYDAVAYHTEYPGDLVESAVHDAIGPEGKRVEDSATYIIMGTVGGAFVAALLGGTIAQPVALGAAVATVIVGRLWYKSYTHSDKYSKIDAQRLEVQQAFPSIVVQLLNKGAVPGSNGCSKPRWESVNGRN